MVLFLHNTSRVEDEPYPKLLTEKGGRGFPYLVFMSAEGDVITPHKKARSVDGFQETLTEVNDFMRLEQMAKKGDKSVVTPLFICKIKLGRYNFAEATAKRKDLPSESKSEKKEIDNLMIGLEVDSILGKVNRRDPSTLEEATKKLMVMYKAGRKPEKHGMFWFYLMQHGFKVEDAALAEEAFNGVKEAFSVSIRQRWVDTTQKRLDELKEKVKAKGEEKKK